MNVGYSIVKSDAPRETAQGETQLLGLTIVVGPYMVCIDDTELIVKSRNMSVPVLLRLPLGTPA